MLGQEKLDALFNGFQKTKDKVIDTILKAIPDDVAQHIGNSEKELLLGLRAVIDRSIEKIDAGVEKVKQAKCCDTGAGEQAPSTGEASDDQACSEPGCCK